MNRNHFMNNNGNSSYAYNSCNQYHQNNCNPPDPVCNICPPGPQGPVGETVLTVQNPAGNASAITITPLAGGTRAVSAHLIITRIM